MKPFDVITYPCDHVLILINLCYWKEPLEELLGVGQHCGRKATEMPVKFQSNQTILDIILAASKHGEILSYKVLSDIDE